MHSSVGHTFPIFLASALTYNHIILGYKSFWGYGNSFEDVKRNLKADRITGFCFCKADQIFI